jgi:hypothetical protein
MIKRWLRQPVPAWWLMIHPALWIMVTLLLIIFA